MFIPWQHESVRLTGRWDRRDEAAAVTTATGAQIELAFSGDSATLRFDMNFCVQPVPRLWIQVDGGAMVESPISEFMKVFLPGGAGERHFVRAIFKSAVEAQHRWYQPLEGKVAFMGFEAENAAELTPDERALIEFVGDSITEGVLIEPGNRAYPREVDNRVFQDDVCQTYAWQTADMLNFRVRMMGYGAVGATKSGSGSVPRAAISYPQAVDGVPLSEEPADIVVLNHGANDRVREEEYAERYRELLAVVRRQNPAAMLVCLSAFCGRHAERLGRLVAEFNRETGDSVQFIDSTGWIPEEPLHPERAGHSFVAYHLAGRIADLFARRQP